MGRPTQLDDDLDDRLPPIDGEDSELDEFDGLVDDSYADTLVGSESEPPIEEDTLGFDEPANPADTIPGALLDDSEELDADADEEAGFAEDLGSTLVDAILFNDDSDEDSWTDDRSESQQMFETWIDPIDLSDDETGVADDDLCGEVGPVDDVFDELGSIDEELSLSELDEPALRLAGTLPGAWSPAKMRVEVRGREPVYVLGQGGGELVAGERLYRARSDAFESLGVEGSHAEVLSIVELDAAVLLATGWHGVQRSVDHGRTFMDLESAPKASRAPRVELLLGSCLWARDGAGHLYRSSDGGESWTAPIEPMSFSAWSVDGDRVVLLCASKRGFETAASEDGEGWDLVRVHGLRSADASVHRLCTRDGAVAIACPEDRLGPLLALDGRRYHRLPSLADCHLLAFSPVRPGVLYAVLRLAEGVDVLLRHDEGVEATILDLSEAIEGDPSDVAARIVFSLDAERLSKDVIRLRLGTSSGLVLIELEEPEP